MKRLLCMLACLTGCEGYVTVVQPVEVSGTIATVDGHDGPVRLEVYQAWSGEDDLRYPMRFIDAEKPGFFKRLFGGK